VILRHHADAEIRGLDEFEGKHPPVGPVFWAFRVMVGIAVLMLLTAWSGAWMMRGGREPGSAWLRVAVAMTFSGWVATLAGWYVTEIGRQPYLVYGLLTTAEAANPAPVPVGISLALYLLLYAVLITAYIGVLFYMAGKGGSTSLAAQPDLARRAGETDGA
jgi:cytochrome d ubiquinol oxidase subunit I